MKIPKLVELERFSVNSNHHTFRNGAIIHYIIMLFGNEKECVCFGNVNFFFFNFSKDKVSFLVFVFVLRIGRFTICF